MLQLLRERLFVPISISAYSHVLIQLSELWQRGMKEIAKASKRQLEDLNPGYLDWEPDALSAMLPRPTRMSPCSIKKHTTNNKDSTFIDQHGTKGKLTGEV